MASTVFTILILFGLVVSDKYESIWAFLICPFLWYRDGRSSVYILLIKVDTVHGSKGVEAILDLILFTNHTNTPAEISCTIIQFRSFTCARDPDKLTSAIETPNQFTSPLTNRVHNPPSPHHPTPTFDLNNQLIDGSSALLMFWRCHSRLTCWMFHWARSDPTSLIFTKTLRLLKSSWRFWKQASITRVRIEMLK